MDQVEGRPLPLRVVALRHFSAAGREDRRQRRSQSSRLSWTCVMDVAALVIVSRHRAKLYVRNRVRVTVGRNSPIVDRRRRQGCLRNQEHGRGGSLNTAGRPRNGIGRYCGKTGRRLKIGGHSRPKMMVYNVHVEGDVLGGHRVRRTSTIGERRYPNAVVRHRHHRPEDGADRRRRCRVAEIRVDVADVRAARSTGSSPKSSMAQLR